MTGVIMPESTAVGLK